MIRSRTILRAFSIAGLVVSGGIGMLGCEREPEPVQPPPSQQPEAQPPPPPSDLQQGNTRHPPSAPNPGGGIQSSP